MPVTLALGANTITATSELDGSDGSKRNFTSASAVLIRDPGPTTGTLDRATALWVAEDSSAVYWLCGEADECLAQPSCVRVSAVRVDCPTKSRFQPGAPTICGVVVAVHVQGPRLYSYEDPCTGRWRDPVAFVQPAIVRTGRRYRIDEDQADWLLYEINERNRMHICASTSSATSSSPKPNRPPPPDRQRIKMPPGPMASGFLSPPGLFRVRRRRFFAAPCLPGG